MKRKHIDMPILLCILTLLFGCPNSVTDNPENEETSNANDILRALSVAEVDSPPDLVLTSTLDTEETIADPSQWHPLGQQFSVFSPRAEVFSCGVKDSAGDRYNVLFEDGLEGYTASQPFTDDQAWEKNFIKQSVSGDFDGDGLDEIIIIYRGSDSSGILKARYIDNGMTSVEVTLNGTSDSGINEGWITPNFLTNGSLITSGTFLTAACNIDNDDNSELLVTSGNSAFLLDVNTTGSLWSFSVLDSKTYANTIFGISAGDMNGDGIDEIAVTVGDTFAIYTGNLTTTISGGIEMNSLPSAYTEDPLFPKDICISSCAFGDYDGDRLKELAIVYVNSNSNLTVSYRKLSGNSLNEVYNKKIDTPGTPGTQYYLAPQAIDYDGDGSDELYACGYFFDDLNNTGENWSWMSPINPCPIKTATGDVDADGKEDLLALKHLYTDEYEISLEAWGEDSSGKLVTKKTYYASRPCERLANVTICAGNIDNDSALVEYVGHELQYTRPVVIAVLASPPYYSEIAATNTDGSYNYSEWVTSFGQKTGTSTTETVSMGFSVGMTVEVEQEVGIFGIKLAQIHSSTSFKTSFDWRMGETVSKNKEIKFNCYGGGDRVIYTSVPMDVYEYVILTNPNAGEEDTIGKSLILNIPRDFSTYSNSRIFYNDNNGSLDDIVMDHTVGDVSSYLSEPVSGTYSVGPIAAGDSGGDTSLIYEYVYEEEDEISIDLSVDQSVGAGAGGVTAILDLGFHGGFAYTSTASKGLVFEGTVGNLPAAYLSNPNYAYQSGLFAHRKVANDQEYWEVTYWVE